MGFCCLCLHAGTTFSFHLLPVGPKRCPVSSALEEWTPSEQSVVMCGVQH